ncbi:MAG TPA: hypothetical protein VIF10_01350 [Methylobacter sp.]|jgi:hypothetical protein
MKTLILVVTASLAAASTAANAASTNDCTQILETLKASASAIAQNADSYWRHRANFVSLNYGQARQAVPNALTAAGQEKSHGDALRAAMPNSVASFNDQVTVALSKNCLSPTQLSAIVEPTIKHARRVNFDKFPEDEGQGHPIESSVNPAPPRMPNN